MNYLLDTSALVKRYHIETGTERVNTLFADKSARLFISDIAMVEFHSTLVRRVRTGELEEPRLAHALAQFANDVQSKHFRIIRVGDPIKRQAIALLLKHGPTRALYALDALHLAVAVTLNRERREMVFVTADQRLASVTELEGLRILNPEEEPQAEGVSDVQKSSRRQSG